MIASIDMKLITILLLGTTKTPDAQSQSPEKGDENPGTGRGATGIIVGVLVPLILVAAIIGAVVVKRRRPNPQEISTDELKEVSADENKEVAEDENYLYTSSETEATLPTHISLQKDSNLKEKSTNMAQQVESLEEFKSLVNFVKENVKKEMTIRNEEKNKEHNRYIDIGKIS